MNAAVRRLCLPVLMWCGPWVWGETLPPLLDADRYLRHIKYLSSAEMRGRGTGSVELDRAAEYIAGEFRSIGLTPVRSRTYYQEFPVTTNARLGPGNSFGYSDSAGPHVLELHREFVPLNFSATGKFAGRVVFAGYGITAAEYDYDDYAGVDVRDKLVLLLRHEPQEFDESSVFAGRVYTEHAQLFSKALNARMHGARGVIFVNDTANHGGGGELDKFESAVGPGGAGIPFVHIKADVADRWLEAGGASMSAIQSSIDKELKPRSFALPDSLEVRLRVDIDRELKDVRNVAGYLPGDRPEYVVIGAHYDHIGLGHQYSMAPAEAGKPHPGADDNASGVAGVIELARWFAAQPRRPRGMLFLAFAGEELGLLGSSHWVNHAELPLNRAVAMINLDMIGRIRDGRVYIGGVGTGSTFRGLFDPPQTEGGLKIDFSDATGYGSSDHASFTTKDVPVLFFFSGLHDDYHRPGDTWEKISARETTQLLELVARVTSRLAESDTRPRFIPARAIRPDGNQD